MVSKLIFRLEKDELDLGSDIVTESINGNFSVGSNRLSQLIPVGMDDKVFLIAFESMAIKGSGKTFDVESAYLTITETASDGTVIVSADVNHPNLVKGGFHSSNPSITFIVEFNEADRKLYVDISDLVIPPTTDRKLKNITIEMDFQVHVILPVNAAEYNQDLTVFERLVDGECIRNIKNELNLKMVQVVQVFHRAKRVINNKLFRDNVIPIDDKITICQAKKQQSFIKQQLNSFRSTSLL